MVSMYSPLRGARSNEEKRTGDRIILSTEEKLDVILFFYRWLTRLLFRLETGASHEP